MLLYKSLLLLYPKAFRDEYASDLCSIYKQRRQETSGSFGVLIFWLKEFLDTLQNALHVHLDILRRDVRFGFRTITRNPAFAFTAIIVTALGIGANTAVFSVVNHVLVRPLPYADSERIVRVYETSISGGWNELSPPNFRDWRQRTRSFTATAVYTDVSMNLIGTGSAERLDGVAATAELLPLLGVNPLLGRVFTPQEDRPGMAGTVLLSYSLWQNRFAGDPRVVGQAIRLNESTYTIIGIMPRTFMFPDRNASFWIPIRFEESDFEDRDNNYLDGVARLKPDVTLEQARAETNILAAQLEREYPMENAKTLMLLQTLRESISRQSRLLLGALFGAALCLLLIACTNVANLFLVRAISRRRELTVRSALGAGKEQLVRQLMTESLLLASAGALLGLLLAHGGVPLLTKLIPQTLPAGDATILDWRVLGFAILLLFVTAFIFGVIPPLRMFSRTDASTLREAPRSVTGDRKERLRSVLVAAEVAACVILLICGGLLIRAIWKVQAIEPGFQSENVWTLQTPLSMPKYEKTARRVDFYSRVLSQVRGLPDVTQAAYISSLPMVMRGGIWAILREGGVEPNPGESKMASLRYVTPGFFETLQIPLRRGRDISESDTYEAPKVAVVSESFARIYWPNSNENPIGRRFHIAFHDRTIVGVVGDVKVRGLESASEPQVYLPYKQVDDGALSFYVPRAMVIRTKPDQSAQPYDRIRTIVQKTDSEIPVSDMQTMQDILEGETASRKTQISVIGIFAVLSLVLAGIGIHGLLSFAVSQRVAEIGLRIALGAGSGDIVKMVAMRGVQVAVAGAVIGILLGYAAARAMQVLLAGIKPYDVSTFAASLLIAVLMTLSGCLAPAIRALRIDPARAMRNE